MSDMAMLRQLSNGERPFSVPVVVILKLVPQPPLQTLRYPSILFWFTGKSTAARTPSACSRVEGRLIPWWTE
jgi:hypothetical protein